MVNLKTAIFIDGRNFHSNLTQFAFQTDNENRPYRLDEKHFDWARFFPSVIQAFNTEQPPVTHRLMRVYWYNADDIVPFQANPKAINHIIERYKSQFPQLTAEMLEGLAKQWYEKERNIFYTMKEKIYEDIQRKTDFLEFKGTGKYVVKPFSIPKNKRGSDLPQIECSVNEKLLYRGRRIGEKGVDIGMAVDMVAKMPYYDVAVIISGDADFVPVVKYLKDQLKQVYQLSIAKGVPPRIQYLSPWLKSICDRFESFDEEKLLSEFLKRKSVPKKVLTAIDQRCEDLKQTRCK